MGEKHIIEVRNTHSSSDNDNSNVSSVSSESTLGFTNLFGKSSSLNVGKMIGVAVVAKAALDTASYLCKELPLKILSRVGEYQCDTQKQTQINEMMSGFSSVGRLVANPVSFIVDEAFNIRDQTLQSHKNNEDAEYLRKTLLISSSSDGKRF